MASSPLPVPDKASDHAADGGTNEAERELQSDRGTQRADNRARLGEAIVGAINATLRLRPATTWEDVTAVLRMVDRAVWARSRRPRPARGGCRILPPSKGDKGDHGDSAA